MVVPGTTVVAVEMLRVITFYIYFGGIVNNVLI